MNFSAMVTFGSPASAFAAIILAIAILAVAAKRRPDVPPTARWIALAGVVCLATAAGEPNWQWPGEKTVDVLVDLSPSTRGARFRDSEWLSRRIDELLGNTPFRTWAFADGSVVPLQAGWPEIPATQTRFPNIDADAILLFSDGRFPQPKWAPPTYIVADINLENVADAAVENLEIRDHTLTATIHSTDRQRAAIFDGVKGSTLASVPSGHVEISRPLAEQTSIASVQLEPGDLWPENDSMSIRNSSLFASERWWVGRHAPPGDASGWRVLSPVELPEDSGRYLSPAVIVLDNVGAWEISQPICDELTRYVRDLGGSLLILGGDHAFAAGHYTGSDLETLSPLASTPPQPTMRWILLVDGSGSMADATAGVSRWQAATEAAVRLLSLLPPHDPVWIGQFSNLLRWWSAGTLALETAQMNLPPEDAVPFGPTDLEAALDKIAGDADATMATQLMVLSDCDTRIDQPEQLSQILLHKKIRFSVLALAHGSGFSVIQGIADKTGGQVIEQRDADRWTESLRKLGEAAMANHVMQTPITVHFMNDAQSVPGGTVSEWNRVWLKQDAIPWAQSSEPSADSLAAVWHIGRGSVAAVAFSPSAEQLPPLLDRIALQPRDPRFAIKWSIGRNVKITIEATDQEKYSNDLKFALEISSSTGPTRQEISQIAPGQYSASIDAPLQPVLATVFNGEKIVDRIAIPGRYAPEFDALGNDHESMQQLARMSGGAVIWPGNSNQIDFHWPVHQESLAPWLSGIGAALIAAALLRLRAY
jgi:hypothetical protein